MKHTITLTVTSLLTILFSSFHLADTDCGASVYQPRGCH